MRLEMANGDILDVKDSNDVGKALDSLNSGNDFAILGDDSFVQAAWSEGGFVAEYRTGGGYFRSLNESLPLDQVKELFNGFLTNSAGWKDGIQWTEAETGGAAAGTSSSSSSPEGKKGFVDDIADQLKRDAVNWGKRKLKRFLKF